MAPKRSGPPYRRIVITFWNDPDVKNVLSRDEKLLASYLFTNEHSHPCGVYGLRPLYVADELGFSREEFHEMMAGPLSKFATYDWRTEEVFVHGMGDHQIDGNGLHGQDRRLIWVTTQLQTIHSRELLDAFRARYSDWNLNWREILDEGISSSGEGASDGGSDGAYEGASDGSAKALPSSLNHAEKEGASDGAYEGASEASPRPSPRPSTGLSTSEPTAGDTNRPGGEDTWEKRELHPDTDRLWGAGPDRYGIRDHLHEAWHQGREKVDARMASGDGKLVGLGLERELVSDLLHECDGDADEVAWLIRRAHRVLGLDEAEPYTLYVIAGGSPNAAENLAMLRAAYQEHQEQRVAPIAEAKNLARAKKLAPEERSPAQREAIEKLERARSAT